MASLIFTIAWDTTVTPPNTHYLQAGLVLTRNGQSFRPLLVATNARSGLACCTDLQLAVDADLYVVKRMLERPTPNWEIEPTHIGLRLARELAGHGLLSQEEFTALLNCDGVVLGEASPAAVGDPDHTLLLKATLEGCTLTPLVDRTQLRRDPNTPYINGYIIRLRTCSDRLETGIDAAGMPVLTPEVRAQLSDELRRINPTAR